MKNITKKVISIISCAILLLTTCIVPAVADATTPIVSLNVLKAAEEKLKAAEAKVDGIVAGAAFYENFEGDTQKVGYRNGGSATKVTVDIPEENGNKYGRVTVNTGHANSGYYGVLDSTPVPVTDTDYYKVIFDYKITGTVNNNIRFYRTKAATSEAVGQDYLNDVGEWKTFEYSTPKYSTESTVFYLQITGATPAGTEICVDNFMVMTTTDYEKYTAAKAEYATAKAEYDEVLANLSPELLALITAEENLDAAKVKIDGIVAAAAFFEDFEDETQKVGYRNGGSQTKVTTEVFADNGNKYGKVTVNEGHAQSGYYGVLDSTPVPVTDTDYYKVIFDYKIIGTVNNSIRFYRTKAATSEAVGQDYLNDVGEWKTFEYSTPKYSTESTVFYLQITGATPAGTEICVDNFMVMTTTDYEKLVEAKAEYATAKAEYDEALANLSPELLALINAEKNLNNAQSAVEEIVAGAAFFEDFEDETQKVGYRNGGSQTKVTTEVFADNGNKYGKVTVNEGHAHSGYYGVLDATPVSVNNTDYYKVIFDYKITGTVNNNIRFYRTSASSTTGVGEGYLNDVDEWKTFEYSTPKYSIDSTVFYLQITGATPAGTEICVDNFMVMTTTDYEKLVEAKAEYATAKADYETALEEYNNKVSHVHKEELTHHQKIDATCKETGTIEYWDCSCGKLFSDADATTEISESDLDIPVDANNHVGDTEIRDAATGNCGEDGYTGDTYCKGCGAKTATGTTVPATNNHGGGTASCTDEAVCTTCGKSYGEKDSNNHVGGTEIRGRVEAKEFEDGYTGDTYCKGCDQKLSDGERIPANHEHTLTAHEKVAATCKQTGTKAYWECTCGKLFADADAADEISRADLLIVIDANNHEGGTEIKNAVLGNCGEDGYTGDTYCKGCGAKTATGTTVPATNNHGGGTASCTDKAVCTTCGKSYGEKDSNNHTGGTEIKNAVLGNCGEDGYTGDTYCKGCGAKTATGTTVPATNNHSGGTASCTDKAICTTCGKSYGEKDSNNHTGGTEIKNAVLGNCGEDGYTGDTYCKGCGAKTATGTTVPATNNHGGGTASCTDKAVCATCGKSYGEKDSNNHVGGTEIRGRVEAKEFEDGYTGDTYCKGCDQKLSDGERIPANHEHTLTAHEKVAATCKQTGTKAYWDCTCGKLFSDENGTVEVSEDDLIIPIADHILTHNKKVDATTDSQGTKEHWSCSTCDKLFADDKASTEVKAGELIIPAIDTEDKQDKPSNDSQNENTNDTAEKEESKPSTSPVTNDNINLLVAFILLVVVSIAGLLFSRKIKA